MQMRHAFAQTRRATSTLTAHVHAGSDDLVHEQELRRHNRRALEHLRKLNSPRLANPHTVSDTPRTVCGVQD